MTALRDLRRVGVTLLGVVLLFAAVFAGSYAFAHQEHQHHAQAVLLGSERAAMAKIAAQSHGASCQVAGVQPGQLSGILSIPALQPRRAGRGGHRRPGAQRGRRARPAVGLARGGRRRRLPGPRRQLLRAPQPAQARRRDHVPDGVQHGEVPGERRSRSSPPARRCPTRPSRAWCSTRAGRPTRSSSPRTACWSGPPRWAPPPRAPTSTRGRSSSRPCSPPTTRRRPRRRCRRRA